MNKNMKIIGCILVLILFCSCENKNSELIDEYFFDEASLGGSRNLKIGDLFHGGKVAYIFQPTDNGYIAGEIHGIVAFITDLPAAYKWYNGSNIITGANLTGKGTGDDNSKIIYEKQGAGNYAASMCLSFATGSYSDWFLPSVDELQILYDSMQILGGFSTGSSYWSSSEVSFDGAYGINFSTGLKVKYYKDGSARIRPISYF
jgi:hypothetical protein